MTKYKYLALFVFTVILAFALRFAYLDKFPPALNWDEISHGYNAYSILKTGADQWGQKFPLVNFRAYGDYPLPLNLYITIPSIVVFGLNAFSIRFPHVILGVLTVVATYFLALGLTKRRGLALLASFLVAVEPWTLFTSRIVLQQNVSIFLLVTAMAAFFNWHKSKYLLPLSLVSLFLSLFAYHSTRIFSPMILVAAVIIYRQDFKSLFKKGGFLFALLISVVLSFLVLAAAIILEPSSRARGQWLFIINQSAVNKIIENRNNSKLPVLISKVVYNRPTYFASQFTKNYLEYFSPKFLFLNGGTQYQYSLPGFGLSYLINLPFFYLGLLILLKRAKDSTDYQFILVWLLLSPIPGAITNEHFAVTRISTMLPLPQILSALGAFFVFDYLNKKTAGKYKSILVALYLIGIYFFAESYLINYFIKYPRTYSWSWQYGYRQAVEYTKANYSKYDKIIVTKKYGEPHEFFLFYWPWDPAKYQNDSSAIRFFQSGWYWVDRLDKFYFVNDWQIPKSGQTFVLESKGSVDCTISKCLLITGPGNYPSEWKKLETIKFLDGNPAFEIYAN
ncbi:phospholipid carrier-dependent glycosyltransferase [Patescibacteria group bacterium]|nr:phospholipid carrier-dependent glycosyltransferase [Patescibacteria group bacterium]